jgi:hypothetical protein
MSGTMQLLRQFKVGFGFLAVIIFSGHGVRRSLIKYECPYSDGKMNCLGWRRYTEGSMLPERQVPNIINSSRNEGFVIPEWQQNVSQLTEIFWPDPDHEVDKGIVTHYRPPHPPKAMKISNPGPTAAWGRSSDKHEGRRPRIVNSGMVGVIRTLSRPF